MNNKIITSASETSRRSLFDCDDSKQSLLISGAESFSFKNKNICGWLVHQMDASIPGSRLIRGGRFSFSVPVYPSSPSVRGGVYQNAMITGAVSDINTVQASGRNRTQNASEAPGLPNIINARDDIKKGAGQKLAPHFIFFLIGGISSYINSLASLTRAVFQNREELTTPKTYVNNKFYITSFIANESDNHTLDFSLSKMPVRAVIN
jgi:hypothetical protein